MARKTGICRRNIARVFAILFLIIQGGILDFYLIRDEGLQWYTWLITDVIVLATWITAMIISYRQLNKKQGTEKITDKGLLDDELAFAYLAWLVYALHLVPQIVTLFRLKADNLEEETMAFGPNMLKMCLCITPVLFLFLLFAHHDAKHHTSRKFYIERISEAVTLDLFDSAEMLEYLFDKARINFPIEMSILAFSCINFFLPAFALYELKHNKFHESGKVSPVSFKMIYVCGLLFFVNVPFLVIRLILWHEYDLDISVLLAKNALGIILGIAEVLEFCGEERPKKCDICSDIFPRSSFKSHKEACMRQVQVLNSPETHGTSKTDDIQHGGFEDKELRNNMIQQVETVEVECYPEGQLSTWL